MERLPYDHPNYHGELVEYWKARCQLAEAKLANYAVCPFYVGVLVGRSNHPAWGIGMVESVNYETTSCTVRWVKEDKSYEVTNEMPWEELHRATEVGLELGVPIIYEV